MSRRATNAEKLARIRDDFALSTEQSEKLLQLASRTVDLEISGTAISDVSTALDAHVADSLSGLRIDAIKSARTAIDIGAGVGFPGLVLAIARPDLSVTLLDSVRKKMETASSIARELDLKNVDCVWARVEEFSAVGSDARESFDLVTSRALAPLAALLEYSAPLLREPIGSDFASMVAWKGDPDSDELAMAEAAAAVLGMSVSEPIPASPYPGSRARQFFLAEKRSATDQRFPRRPGVALRKPLSG
ncbi:MAG: 16S rRNA (guanine(527)-N(7))-methyltransferase RsmG [Solirubrobacterales bacterium]